MAANIQNWLIARVQAVTSCNLTLSRGLGLNEIRTDDSSLHLKL